MVSQRSVVFLVVTGLTFACAWGSTGCEQQDIDHCEQIGNSNNESTPMWKYCQSLDEYVLCYRKMKPLCPKSMWEKILNELKKDGIDVDTYSSSNCCDLRDFYYVCNVNWILSSLFKATNHQECLKVEKARSCTKDFFDFKRANCTSTKTTDRMIDSDKAMAKKMDPFCASVSMGCEQTDWNTCDALQPDINRRSLTDHCGQLDPYVSCYQDLKPKCSNAKWDQIFKKMNIKGLDLDTYTSSSCCTPMVSAFNTCNISKMIAPGFNATKQQCLDVTNAQSCTKNYFDVVKTRCTYQWLTDGVVEASNAMAKKQDACPQDNGQTRNVFNLVALLPAIFLGLRGLGV